MDARQALQRAVRLFGLQIAPIDHHMIGGGCAGKTARDRQSMKQVALRNGKVDNMPSAEQAAAHELAAAAGYSGCGDGKVGVDIYRRGVMAKNNDVMKARPHQGHKNALGAGLENLVRDRVSLANRLFRLLNGEPGYRDRLDQGERDGAIVPYRKRIAQRGRQFGSFGRQEPLREVHRYR